jgi:hypothetical protein
MNNPISGFFNNFVSAFGYKDRSQSVISALLGEKEENDDFFDKFDMDYYANQPINIIGMQELQRQKQASQSNNEQPNQNNQSNEQLTNTIQTTTPLSSEDIKWSNLPSAISGFQTANRGKGDIKRIVLHETLGETTKAAISTLKERGLSYHTIVDNDKDGIATKYVDPKDIAWGAKRVNEDSINIAAAHTESQHDIKPSQQHTFAKLIREYVKLYDNGEPIEISYHGQHGGTDCNIFGTHEAYENWVKTKLGDLLQAGKIKLSNSSITVNQPDEPGTRVA